MLQGLRYTNGLLVLDREEQVVPVPGLQGQIRGAPSVQEQKVEFTGLVVKKTGAPKFVHFFEKKGKEKGEEEKDKEQIYKEKTNEFSDVIDELGLTGDLNVKEKNYVRRMAELGFRRKIFKQRNH